MTRYEQTRRRPQVGEAWVRKNGVRVEITRVDEFDRWVYWKRMNPEKGKQLAGGPLMSTFLANHRHEEEATTPDQ